MKWAFATLLAAASLSACAQAPKTDETVFFSCSQPNQIRLAGKADGSALTLTLDGKLLADSGFSLDEYHRFQTQSYTVMADKGSDHFELYSQYEADMAPVVDEKGLLIRRQGQPDQTIVCTDAQSQLAELVDKLPAAARP